MAEEIVPAETPPVKPPEGGEPTPPVEDPVAAPPEPSGEPTPPEGEPTGEPGGSDGAAVYQRKLFRENKILKDKIQAQEVETARKEERLKVAEEQKTAPKTDKIYTYTEIQRLVRDGKIEPEEGDRYIDEILLPKSLDLRLAKHDQEREEKDKRERPINKAKAEVNEYVQLIPSLTNDGDPGANQVFQRYNELISEYGYAENDITKLAAIQYVKGPLDKLRTQSEVRTLTRNGTGTHTETGAGGSDGKVAEDAVKKVPADMVAHWEKQGCTPEQIKIYAGKHLAKMNIRRSRYG